MKSKILKIVSNESAVIKVIINFMLVVFATSFAHWGFVKFYYWNCIDPSWVGMFTNLINLGSPFCQFINYLQFEISKYYVYIWASAGIAIIAYFAGKK